LAEVEAVCDRVAMLRAGRLVECGTLEVLRRYTALRVRVVLSGPVPDLSGVAGVRALRVDGQVVECDVAGPVQPLLTALAGSVVERMTTTEPSLEELFLSRYGEADATPAVAP
ncbi:MAG: ABC transporter ATP-binding protein, partial [Actinobacteria bacterium]|nr:ABC transporter ATP-binding protein [Actinomycetota bacterium]